MERIRVGEVSLEAFVAGDGPPVLFLHGGDYFRESLPFLERLAGRRRVIAPRHPGFGASERPADFRTVDDLAYFYLDLLDRLALEEVLLVGSSFGGWIALEMAVRCLGRIGRLALIDSLGVKFGDRESRDIADIYALAPPELERRLFFRPERWIPNYAALPEAAVAETVRDRLATALYGWRPYMHNPGLRKWLGRVRVPALVLWGEDDGIVAPEYGESLCRALPQARFERIAEAGHYPHIEQVAAVAAALDAFAPA